MAKLNEIDVSLHIEVPRDDPRQYLSRRMSHIISLVRRSIYPDASSSHVVIRDKLRI